MKMCYLFLFCILISFNGHSQWGPHNILGEEEYQLIKDKYSNSERDFYLYEYTDFDNTWAHFFSPEHFKELNNYDHLGTISFDELTKLFSEKYLSKISWAIDQSIPLKWDSNLLPGHFKITNSYNEKSDISKRVHRITKPIILDDLAVVFVKTFQQGTINFLQKNENHNWEVIFSSILWVKFD